MPEFPTRTRSKPHTNSAPPDPPSLALASRPRPAVPESLAPGHGAVSDRQLGQLPVPRQQLQGRPQRRLQMAPPAERLRQRTRGLQQTAAGAVQSGRHPAATPAGSRRSASHRVTAGTGMATDHHCTEQTIGKPAVPGQAAHQSGSRRGTARTQGSEERQKVSPAESLLVSHQHSLRSQLTYGNRNNQLIKQV